MRRLYKDNRAEIFMRKIQKGLILSWSHPWRIYEEYEWLLSMRRVFEEHLKEGSMRRVYEEDV